MLFFGSGDREHPKNTNVHDRMYALKDKDLPTNTTVRTESDLYDATSDDLQTTTSSSTITSILTTLASDTNYGWFITLETSGEKALASPTVFNKVAYFTTYAPGASTDVCKGDAGNAFEYALNYKTGEAVLNFDTSNDGSSTTNTRAQSHINGVDGGTGNGGFVLLKSDRRKGIGSGIPSGDIIVINPNGQLKSYTGVGGSIAADNPVPGGAIVPLYWRQK
jgi:type IV pilus assembly protein PilY1